MIIGFKTAVRIACLTLGEFRVNTEQGLLGP